MTIRRLLVLSLALALGLSAGAFAAVPGTMQLPLPQWQYGVITLGPASFQVRDCMWSQAYLEYEQEKALRASLRVTEGFPNVAMAAPLPLPLRAEITRVKIDYYDTDPLTEPDMGIYGFGRTGLASLVIATPGAKEFSKGDNTVIYQLKPKDGTAAFAYDPLAYEFLINLNRSVEKGSSEEHALYRVEISYRYLVR